MIDATLALTRLDGAVSAKQLTASAAANVKSWLAEPRYTAYVPRILQHVAEGRWKELDDAFWTVLPFGTGGRRGRMYPIGCNAINERTIGESAQGLADYVIAQRPNDQSLSCAIAYDSRHRSREFAELCAEIMAAAGFLVWFLDGERSTPELSFAVRHKKCSCGIMVSASHNPPSDNAVKVYWSTGGQILPPHDDGLIRQVAQTLDIHREPFAEAKALGRVVFCQEEIDGAYQAAVVKQAIPGPRDLKIVYSPLHGVGGSSVPAVLAADGFKQVEVFGPHATPDGDFPNVPGHSANPENPAVFDLIITHARKTGAELILATDPDCDRVGCAAPITHDPSGPWGTFTGNQIGAMLCEYILASRKERGALSREHYVVKTLVTTEMVRRIADAYGVRTLGNLLVGFKWIGGVMDEAGPERFVFGAEESHGYLVGDYARDKDGAVAAMLLAELAAAVKAQRQTLHEKLDALFWQYGCHLEQTISVTMSGAEGMAAMQTLMARLRARPPERLANLRVVAVRDYLTSTTIRGGVSQPLDESLATPRGDMLILDLEAEGNYVAVRPSGTEPKIKFYLFAYEPPEQLANLEETKRELTARLVAMAADLKRTAGMN